MRYENSFLFQKFFSKFSVYSRSASIISLAFSAARSFDCAQDDNHLRHRMTILSFRAPLTFYTLPLSQIPLSFCTLPLSRTPLSFCALPLFQTPLTFCTLPLSRTPLSFCAFAQHTSVILCVCAAHLCHSELVEESHPKQIPLPVRKGENRYCMAEAANLRMRLLSIM